ncbi:MULTISPECIES: Gfo/Idh/MocA family oxidoreductase [unclassified Enterococcus]|uniref:Gfo/Idh/MocA family oxidoreductase n=1 Tax=unclassified Enterococcus TaxID=2608891 RepID=UPI00155757E7|nr:MULTISPECIES: Gfo/Idh/MocA family oxidoreductase [unclassified Enterococcus]MBS7576059.1 Gfo/Idh/MocA family oxidoreductase [Enterococcus sp. MMGLQ5-2]MBS7583292.1 Gfo/Idh/MocA family oxidoreductase [Enterococcus sp. MMGLQ5-1]NPD11152.1 Gfo/Idh/MocA family oxidoreductase [Enterococcus sp. MMGLQ5-1]NPD35895.1 Gfo/Idh/MocA family oxidoreductase [Enterococcus sp. MMGLQ5-2]
MTKKILRVGVIGCGAIGKEHIERLTNVVANTVVVAVYDYFEEVAQSVAAKYQIEAAPSGEALIAREDIDAILITSTDDTHAGYVFEALKFKKYIFCEKPLALTAEECQEMMAKEVQIGKRLIQVGFNRRFDIGYREMKQAIQAGEIGEPLLIHSAHRNISQAAGFKTDYAITRVAIHEIDITRWLLDEEYEEVQVLTVKQSRKTSGDWLNPQLVMFKTRSGQRIDVEVQTDGAYAYDIQCQVVGEDGTLNLPDPARVLKRASGHYTYGLTDHWAKRFIDSYDTEFKEWAASVLKEKLVGPSAWDGYVSCVVADRLIQSRISGEAEKIELIEKADIY